MHSNISNGSRAAWARGFAALWAALALVAAFSARPAEAAPFAYVANVSGTVSAIATAANMVAATVTVGVNPAGVAFTPDGTQAYVTNSSDGTVPVIDTSTKTVVGTPIPVGTLPLGVAFALDGNHAYVANRGSGTVSVIRTAKQKVVATVAVGTSPFGVAIMA